MNEFAKKFQFSFREFSGSLGDLGLFIPLVVAMTITCDLNIGVVLILAGIMNVVTGLMFNQPIPVQPMKALATVVIAESMLSDELYAAGIMIGVILIICSFYIKQISEHVPKAVVRGIQLGVGAKLVVKAFTWIKDLPLMGWDSILVVLITALILILFINRKKPILFFVFLAGCVLLSFEDPAVVYELKLQMPQMSFYFPPLWAFKHSFFKGVLPQLPLTLLNSVIAVCALSADYYGKNGISQKKMALSVGLMNLVAIPLGGIPMCHGASGLAAQYKFGARTGGSVIMLGIVKVMLGFLFGQAIFTILQTYPMAILAVMLIFAGVELAKTSKDCMHERPLRIIVFSTAGFIIFFNTFIGFIIGYTLSLIIKIIQRSEQNVGQNEN